jgi:hypothetical protein
MSGLYLSGGISGVQPTMASQYGSSQSYMSGLGATGSAFAGPSTNPIPTLGSAISPTQGFGLAVWIGMAAVVGLIVLRRSLPN